MLITQWFFNTLFAATKTVVILHGLNQEPTMFSDLESFFQENNFKTHQILLQGHYEKKNRLEAFKKASKDLWLTQAREQLKKFKNENFYLFGYSMGGLIGSYLTSTGEISPKKMILMAPAVHMNTYTHLVKLLYPFKFLNLPSDNLKEYRANDYTPIPAYKAFYDIYDEFQDLKSQKAFQVPSIVFIHPEDELVSLEGLRKDVSKHKAKWSVFALEKCDNAIKSKFHLIYNKAVLGKQCFEKTTTQILAFLTQPKISKP
jgi:esterase/lipase